MTAAASSNNATPIVHAIGGSVGSALALLLFYPLERARIELQSQTSSAFRKQPSTTTLEETQLLNSVEVALHLDGASPSLESSADEVSSSSSWSPVHKELSKTDPPANESTSSPSWDLESKEGTSDEVITRKEVAVQSDLFRCLGSLYERGSLYQGVTPVVTTVFASQFVFFYLHAYVKKLMQQLSFFGGSNSTASSRAILSLAVSCIAGIGNVLMTNPLWVANMSIVTGESKEKHLLQELGAIFRAKGLQHLWSGTRASILLVSNPVIQFFSYEQIKNARLACLAKTSSSLSVQSSLPPPEAFVVGAVAKTVATILTYPLQLTQTVLRLKDNEYKGIIDCLVKLYRRAGYKEWYTGMKAKLLQTVLTAAFTFLTYEQILHAVHVALARSAGLPTV